jgi:hypothetical protein
MNRMIIATAILMSWWSPVIAQDCAQEVLRNLYAELEAIDSAGEERLAQSLDELSVQEGWSEHERSDFTLSIADNADVDAAESQRTDIIGRLIGSIQRGNVDCAEIQNMRAAILDVEKAQWESAVKRVEQRIWH